MASKKYQREWYIKNADKQKAYTKNYYQEHKNEPEFKRKAKEAARKDYLKHKKAYLSREKKWRRENPERYKKFIIKYRKKNRKRMAAYSLIRRKKNKTKIRKCMKAYYKQHKAQFLERNRQRRLENPMCEKPARLRFEIMSRDGFKCQYCGRFPREDGVKLAIDHIYPKSKGGPDAKDNLITACYDCNLAKFDVLLSELAKKKSKQKGECYAKKSR